jgi:hypothetical protein
LQFSFVSITNLVNAIQATDYIPVCIGCNGRLLLGKGIDSRYHTLCCKYAGVDVARDCYMGLHTSGFKQNALRSCEQFQPKIARGLLYSQIALNFAPDVGNHLPNFFQHSKDVGERKALPIRQTLL